MCSKICNIIFQNDGTIGLIDFFQFDNTRSCLGIMLKHKIVRKENSYIRLV